MEHSPTNASDKGLIACNTKQLFLQQTNELRMKEAEQQQKHRLGMINNKQ